MSDKKIKIWIGKKTVGEKKYYGFFAGESGVTSWRETYDHAKAELDYWKESQSRNLEPIKDNDHQEVFVEYFIYTDK